MPFGQETFTIHFMNKVMSKINFKAIASFIKSALVVLVVFAVVYGLFINPMSDRAERIACHNQTFAGAQQIGAEILEQNQDNEELTEQQVQQEVNGIIAQAYESNYALCLRSKGL